MKDLLFTHEGFEFYSDGTYEYSRNRRLDHTVSWWKWEEGTIWWQHQFDVRSGQDPAKWKTFKSAGPDVDGAYEQWVASLVMEE